MKKLVSINDENLIKKYINEIDGLVIGIEGLSINYPTMDIDTIINLIEFFNKNNKEIFVVLNKNIHNNEIDYVTNILLKLKNITGLFYYDNAILNLKNKLNLEYNLVIDQEHSMTNYQTINYYNEYGVKYVHLSSDITLKEMLEIKKNTNSKIILTIFGYLPMFASQRNLVKNYLEKFKINDNSKRYYMEKEGKVYNLIDNELGTFVYTDEIYSLLDNKEIENFDYILFNGLLIDDFEYIIKNINNYFNILNKYKTNPYFKNIETVYKVK